MNGTNKTLLPKCIQETRLKPLLNILLNFDQLVYKKTIYAVLTLFINIFCFCVFVSTGIA